MATTEFQRARSVAAKQQREEAILDAARRLGEQHGIRRVTLTDIAEAVDLHKSAMLRYFETREQIFLTLTAAEWRSWSSSLRARTGALPSGPATTDGAPAGAASAAATVSAAGAAAVAAAMADSLVERPLFCDLLAQAPLNLERNASLEAVRAFKLVTLNEVDAIAAELHRLLGLTPIQAVDVVATATSMAGALWQMATPGPDLQQLYRSDPRLAHAVVEVGPRLTRVLTALLIGLTAPQYPTEPAEDLFA